MENKEVKKSDIEHIENLIKTLDEEKIELAFQLIDKLNLSGAYLKHFRDLYAVLSYAHNEGLKEGRKIAIAKNMIRRGTPIEFIVEDTGLSVQEIEELRKNKLISISRMKILDSFLQKNHVQMRINFCRQNGFMSQ